MSTALADPVQPTAHVSAVRLATTQTVAAPQLTLPAQGTRGDLGDLLSAGDATTAADVKMWLGEPRKATRTASIRRFARGIVNRTSSIAASLTRNAMRFIGTPYVFGGTSPSGFDCSGYTQHIFAMLGIHLPRTADAQYYSARRIRGDMTPGDLVFFETYEPGPSHVGIYIGGGRFIHSSSHGVMISRLGDSYWASRYIGAKRVISI
jgi:cell wall-associated NlpC family hydrolase